MRQGGFTLLELLVVLVVLGLTATVLAWRVRDAAGSRDLLSRAAELKVRLAAVRERALRSGLVVPFDPTLPVDGGRGGVTIEGKPVWFLPDGTSSGGRILLRRGERSLALEVDWLTGRTVIHGG